MLIVSPIVHFIPLLFSALLQTTHSLLSSIEGHQTWCHYSVTDRPTGPLVLLRSAEGDPK